MHQLLIVFSVISFSAADLNQHSAEPNRGLTDKSQNKVASFSSHLPIPLNRTYPDRSDNILRVPVAFYDDNKKKRKLKKSPKRTIQKIIKKNRMKTRKIYVNPITISTTIPSKKIDTHSSVDESTTEVNRKRPRKSSKVLRYHMPFQKFQRNTHRNKRGNDRNDIFIIKDLDEMEFLGKDDDDKNNIVVKAHVQSHW